VTVRRVAALALLAFGCTAKPGSHVGKSGADKTKVSQKHVVEFDLTGGIRESSSAGMLFPLAAGRTYTGLIRELEHTALDESASAFFVRLGETDLGWAHAEELGLAFSRLHEKSGKPVVCHATAVDNRVSFFLARACDRTWVSPASDVDTVGIAGQVLYLKSALDKLKISADFLHMGRFKSASEPLTQDGPSDEAKEALLAVLSSIRKTWLDTANAAKKRDVGKALEDGPWSAEDAKAQGLVDAVGYESDARSEAEALGKTDEFVKAFGGKQKEGSPFDAAEILRLLVGSEGATKKPHIVVVPAEGSISMGEESPLSESGIGAHAVQKLIRRLASDDSVKAVVLRIDSPGGSALASDLMWHELMELRKKKPLVASVGDMAASGGYYMACAANKIIAPETSIVGSIGVLGGKIVLSDALAEFGVHTETFPASPAEGAGTRASYLSALSHWDDPTREKVRREMSQVYELFLSRVAEGRGLPVELVRAVAEGRIWSGIQGLRIRLVDEIGGLGKALDVARTLGKVDAKTPIVVEGISETLLESIIGGDDDETGVRMEALTALLERRAPEPHLVDRLAPSLRPFVATLSPLLAGETTLAAMPFGVLVQ